MEEVYCVEEFNLSREGNNIVTPPLLHRPEKQLHGTR